MFQCSKETSLGRLGTGKVRDGFRTLTDLPGCRGAMGPRRKEETKLVRCFQCDQRKTDEFVCSVPERTSFGGI